MPILPLHVGIRFKSPARQNDAPSRRDRNPTCFVILYPKTNYGPFVVGYQPLGAGGKAHLNAARDDIILQSTFTRLADVRGDSNSTK